MSNQFNALTVKQGLTVRRQVQKLSSSPAITITVNTIQTYINNFTMSPTSGNAPFTINFSGDLSDYSSANGDLAALNGETITIQQLIGGTWTNIGVSVVTVSSGGVPGHFAGSIAITLAAYPPGTYQFRANYAGNTTKGLFGAVGNPSPASVGTPTATPSAAPAIILGTGLLAAIAMLII